MSVTAIVPYCVSAYIIHKTSSSNKFLLLRRCSLHLFGTWQVVSGGIKKNEQPAQAALREIKEETGLCPDQFYSADAAEAFYYKAKETLTFVPVYVAFISKMFPVRLSPTEHDIHEWVTYEEAFNRLVFAEQKRIISHIQMQFLMKEPDPLLRIDMGAKKSWN